MSVYRHAVDPVVPCVGTHYKCGADMINASRDEPASQRLWLAKGDLNGGGFTRLSVCAGWPLATGVQIKRG